MYSLYICGLISLTLIYMAQKIIKILVEMPDNNNVGVFKTLYRNTVQIPNDVVFDYNLVERALSLLYPNSLVSFKISAL